MSLSRSANLYLKTALELDSLIVVQGKQELD